MDLLQLLLKLIFIVIFSISTLNMPRTNIINNQENLIITNKPLINKIVWCKNIGSGKQPQTVSLNPNWYHDTIFIADYNGNINSLYLINGITKWHTNIHTKKKHMPALLSGGIALDNTKIYLGSELNKLYAFNMSNGAMVWETTVAGKVTSAPAISNKMIFIHTNNNILQAIDKNTGSIKWTVILNQALLSIIGESSPVVTQDKVIVGNDSGFISMFNINTGQLIWEKYIDNFGAHKNGGPQCKDIDSTPVIVNNKIYAATCNNHLVALDLQDGNLIWHRDIGSRKDFIISDGYMYLINLNNNVLKIRISDGTTIWTQDHLIKRELTVPILYKRHLILANNKGWIYFLDLKNGNINFSTKLGKSFLSKPLIANNILFYQAANLKLYALLLK